VTKPTGTPIAHLIETIDGRNTNKFERLCDQSC